MILSTMVLPKRGCVVNSALLSLKASLYLILIQEQPNVANV